MSWPPSEDDWKRIRERMMQAPEPPVRYVSPKQYDALAQLAARGLLTADGWPKDEDAYAEYERLLRES